MAEAFPLSWPEGWERTPAAQRKASKFRTRYAEAYDNLMRELGLLGASSIVVSTNAPLRRDGRPYTDFMEDDVAEPGVAVYFLLKGQPRVMARDGHPRPVENLHAIGHVIAHLRGIERHGGSAMMMKSFDGFSALPAPGAKRSWMDVLDFKPNDRSQITAEIIKSRFARLATIRHPDKPGGSHDAMSELNRARDEALKEIGS
ncbi:hypothetical protein J2X65_003568 [Ancylobacter sp. 3268]|uniref:J domain-containing protein n=1 Tax=Ancylobacter sp. 3268 TaxID=2817752 RepID=UPI00285FA15E|nr:J domain-containing protein [Ancylobacter sp. 3268]MDR6954200.1 hypothetical protein [Ancylobacter sp. 3268]